jgi:hypothetical protein
MKTRKQGETMDINISSEIVCDLIEKAREFHVKEAVTIVEVPLSPTDDWALQVLADHADDVSYQELYNNIQGLDVDQQITLVALMWLGRGDFLLEEWDQVLTQAGEQYNNRTAEYLIATPLVADYWAEGLDLHGYACE